MSGNLRQASAYIGPPVRLSVCPSAGFMLDTYAAATEAASAGTLGWILLIKLFLKKVSVNIVAF